MSALATGIGSMPGDDDRQYAEAVRLVLGELPELPYVPELPGRGVASAMTGRALAVMSGLGVDLQPAGWRLTDSSGADHRRARSQLAQDLDQVEEQAQDHVGAFKAQVAGPWTLAATVEKPRGDKVLSDHGARRELAQALADGVSTHVADLRRRLPHVERLIIQIDEPSLPAVLAARIPTASGFGRHRAVDLPEASAALEGLCTAITAAGAEPWVHSCAPQTPWSLIRGAGARGIALDAALLDAVSLDAVAEALEAGESVALGVVPSTLTPPSPSPTETSLTEQVLRLLDMLGLDPSVTQDRLVISPACGLAGASYAWSRQALELARATAANL